jgi:hypothetical protein
MANQRKIPLVLWPLAAVWSFLSWVLNIIGRLLTAILAFILMVLGVALTMTIAGAPLGIPFIILGLLLLIRVIFK